MLETLSGRLKWERSDNGIRVIIPARICQKSLRKRLFDDFFAVLLVLFFNFVFGIFDSRSPFRLHYLYFLVPELLFLLGAVSLVKLYTARTTLIFDRNGLNIRSSDLGIWHGAPRKYSTERIYNLRFVRFTPDADIRNGLHMDEMQFDQLFLTHAFGAGIDEQEASALIQRMMEVYPIPASPPEY
jgi:hypothetical protein